MKAENKMPGGGRKGQMSFALKPFTLLMVIVMLLFLVIYMNSSQTKKEEIKRDLELRTAATDTLLLLANSEDCLAFQLPSGESAYANVIDVSKLERFSQTYKGIEPICARNYDFGFRVNITETVMSSKGPRDGKSWTFGMQDITRGYYDNQVSYWLPVALKYSEKEVGLGKMQITIVDGELEKVAGFLDRSCMMGLSGRVNDSSAMIHISYPLSYIDNQLCIGMKNKDCRRTSCNLNMSDLKAAGNYRLMVSFELPNKLIVTT